MSREHVEVVRRNLESFEDDVEGWLDTLDPAVRWYPIEEGHSPVLGHQEALRARDNWLETWDREAYTWEIEELRESGDESGVGLAPQSE